MPPPQTGPGTRPKEFDFFLVLAIVSVVVAVLAAALVSKKPDKSAGADAEAPNADADANTGNAGNAGNAGNDDDDDDDALLVPPPESVELQDAACINSTLEDKGLGTSVNTSAEVDVWGRELLHRADFWLLFVR